MKDKKAQPVLPLVEDFINLMFEDLREVLCTYIKKNNQYGMEDYAAALLFMLGFRASAETIGQLHGIPSPDRILALISSHTAKEWHRIINEMLHRYLEKVTFPKDAKLIVAIDLTDIPFYGDRNCPFACGYKPKKGTTYSVLFLVISIEVPGFRFPVAFYPVTQLDYALLTDYILETLAYLQSLRPIDVVLFDRGFLSRERLQQLADQGYHVIAPLPLTPDVKRGIEHLVRQANKKQLKKGLKSTTLPTSKRVPEGFYVVIVRHRRCRQAPELCVHNHFPWVAFVTNLPLAPKTVVKLYGKRWGIETKFRLVKQVLPPTSSRNFAIRVGLMGLALLWYAAWVLWNLQLAERNEAIRRKKKKKQGSIAITRYQITVPLPHLQLYVVCFLFLKYARTTR